MASGVGSVGRSQGIPTELKVAAGVGLGALGIGLLFSIFGRHKEEIQVGCGNGVLQPACLAAVANLGKDVVQTAGPILANCVPNPASPSCAAAESSTNTTSPYLAVRPAILTPAPSTAG